MKTQAELKRLREEEHQKRVNKVVEEAGKPTTDEIATAVLLPKAEIDDLRDCFIIYHKEIEPLETVARARDDLKNLADSVRTLCCSVENLGPGAMRILTSGSVSSSINMFVSENFPRGKEWMLYENQPEGSLKQRRTEFDPDAELPDYEVGEDAPNTKWINELELLYHEAVKGANRVCSYSSRGAHLAEKMGWKRPNDWLAEKCLNLLDKYHVTETIKNDAISLMQTILDSTKNERKDRRERPLKAGGSTIAKHAIERAMHKLGNKAS